ncbi:hypothetical protein LTR85_011881 [Meristemomyces frigidus]|nr:hypothetical protein LTR85_011881 [Meristemomyces frigidus]
MPPKRSKEQTSATSSATGPIASPSNSVSPARTPMAVFESLRAEQNPPDNLEYSMQLCPVLFDTTGYHEHPKALLLRTRSPRWTPHNAEVKNLLNLPTKSITLNHGWSSEDEADEAEAKAKPISEDAGRTIGEIAAGLLNEQSGIQQPLAAFHAEMYPHTHESSNWFRTACVLVFLRFDDDENHHEDGVDGEQKGKWKWMEEGEVRSTKPARFMQEAHKETVLLGFQALQKMGPTAPGQRRKADEQTRKHGGDAVTRAAEETYGEAKPRPVERYEDAQPVRQRGQDQVEYEVDDEYEDPEPVAMQRPL